jgi:hypothetical protein
MTRCLLALALLPAVLTGADLQIDHVTVAGSSIKTLQANLAAVGIQSVYGGAHVNGATEMALVSFPDGAYLELMALQPNAGPRAVDQHVWAKFLRHDAGPCAWAVREKDIAAEVQRLQSAGIPVAAPVRSGRQRPDGVKLDWQTSDIGSELRGTFFPFLIQDFTPREQRAFPQGRPVTRDFKGISRIVIAVKDLDSAVKRYRQAYGLPEPLRQVDKAFGAQLAFLGGSPVILAQPLTADSWLSPRIEKFGEGPCALVLSAARAAKYHTVSKTNWFGAQISWFDPERLGWRLGFE